MSPWVSVSPVCSGSSQAGCSEWRPLGRSRRALDDVRGIRCQARRRTEHESKLVDPVNLVHSSSTASAQSAARSPPSFLLLAVSSRRLGTVTVPLQHIQGLPSLTNLRRCRREFDKNVASLVDDMEVPRATSAPPHLEDRWAAQLVRLSHCLTRKSGSTTPKKMAAACAREPVEVNNPVVSVKLLGDQRLFRAGGKFRTPSILAQSHRGCYTLQIITRLASLRDAGTMCSRHCEADRFPGIRKYIP